MLQAEIVAIGNELLLGDVLDTNSHWLCQQLTARGTRVRRVVQVRDETAAIGEEIRGALARQTGLIITTGGLGPTDDDLTLAAVAAALGRPLREHPEALAALEERYRLLVAQGFLADGTITPPRRKMVTLPEGSIPLPNPVGTAPGVLLHEGESTLMCLPGVPEEMRAIFEEASAGPLAGLLGGCYAEWSVTVGAGEAHLAPLLRRLAQSHPEVYVKSHARRIDPRSRLHVRLTLSLAGKDEAEVQAGLEAALEDLQGLLAEAGVPIEDVKRSP